MNESYQLFLVEDDDDIGFLMRKSLERSGHHVTVCHTGADALIVLAQTPFDLVLLDQDLPDLRGIELLERLNRDGIFAPSLMVTGAGDEKLASQVLLAGALDYIVKDRSLAFLHELPKRVQESITRHRLQQMNRLLIAALESANDGILITDIHGKIQSVNAAAERFFGYDRGELIGADASILKSGTHPPEFFQEMWRTILNRRGWQGELVNRRKDGARVDLSLAISPIVDSQGQLTNFVGIFRDLSERKNMERQLFQAQKMQSVGTLAGGVAHEFNNLLAGIQGYASLGLRERGVSDSLREFLDSIVQLSDRAANLTRQLLAFARKPALTRRPTSGSRLLEATEKLIRHSLNIDLKVDVALEAAGLTLLADSNQLQQVLVNLALNARDASPRADARPIEFRLRLRSLAGSLPAFPQDIPAGDYALIEVEDFGMGMTAETITRAFDPFFTTKEVGQGTGLGLPVAFGIITGHQGFLSIDSEVGRGTLVRLYLPRIAEPAVAENFGETTGQVLEPEKVTPRTILVVDDEPAIGDVVSRFLRIAGHSVECCACAADALTRLEDGFRPDLILLDMMIPREDGAGNYRTFRRRHPAIPIILCTGLLQANTEDQLAGDEEVDILRKPFRMSELWYQVNKTLGRMTKLE